MITQEEWMDLLSCRSLAASGGTRAEIARLAGRAWRTARKYLSAERPRPPREKLIDAYVETGVPQLVPSCINQNNVV